MDSEQNGTRPPGLYALVIYLPDPLGIFLDDVRREVVPGCNPHAHVSLLPPRPLPAAPEEAIEHARETLGRFPVFDIELGQIEKFDATEVIYISVEGGTAQLREMHAQLNSAALAFPEPFAYHPHVTLAQNIPEGRVELVREMASTRWHHYLGPRHFRAETAVFVKNTQGNLWVDLATGRLGEPPVGPRS